MTTYEKIKALDKACKVLELFLGTEGAIRKIKAVRQKIVDDSTPTLEGKKKENEGDKDTPPPIEDDFIRDKEGYVVRDADGEPIREYSLVRDELIKGILKELRNRDWSPALSPLTQEEYENEVEREVGRYSKEQEDREQHLQEDREQHLQEDTEDHLDGGPIPWRKEDNHLRDAEGYLIRNMNGDPVVSKVLIDGDLPVAIKDVREELLESLTKECETHVDTIEDHLKTIHELRMEMSDMRCTIAFLCGLLGTNHSSEVEHIARTYCNLNFNSRKKD